MKVLTIVLILGAVAVSLQKQTFSDVLPSWIDLIEPYRLLCIKETKVDETLANRLLPDGAYVDNNRLLRCYIKCLMLNMGMFNDQGEVQPEQTKQLIDLSDKAVVREIAQNCFNPQADELCDKAFIMSRCIYQTAQVLLTP